MSWFPNPLCLKLWGIFMKTIFYFFERRTLCSKSANYLNIETTAWKVSKYGVKSGPYFPAFGLNTERYSVSLCIQSEYKKIRTRNNSVFGHFSCSDACLKQRARFSHRCFFGKDLNILIARVKKSSKTETYKRL